MGGPVNSKRPSPSFGPRRDDALPDLVVLHYTAMASASEALDRLCDPDIEVSAHYLICEQGQIWQMVDEDMRAWHAGAGQWGEVTDVNSRSIGIELANSGDHPFPASQMDALESLLTGIMSRHGIVPRGVIGHSDMAPGRKSDPGRRFDWRRLAWQGLSVWPDNRVPQPPDPALFRKMVCAFGYPDVADDLLLDAFRLRFHPQATGPLNAADMARAAGLAGL